MSQESLADLIMSPRWLPLGRCENNRPSTTYDLIEDSHEAHWFMKVVDEGIYQPVEKRHQKHFGLPRSLERHEFEQIPDVTLLLEDVNLERLREAQTKVRDLDIQEFKSYAENNLRAGSAFRQRIKYLGGNWDKLQQVDFHRMTLDAAQFRSVIGQTVVPL